MVTLDKKSEEDIMTEAYKSALDIIEAYENQLALGGPGDLFEILASFQGALKEVQSSITRRFRTEWLHELKQNEYDE